MALLAPLRMRERVPSVSEAGEGFATALHQRRRGEASLASCEVMSANETASEVRTSITVGARARRAPPASAGPSAAGSSTRSPRQPIARAIAAWSKSLNSAANGPEPCNTQPSALVVEDDGDDRDVVLDRGHQPVHRHREPAVAAHRDDRPVGMHELGAERRRDAEPHRPGAGRLQKPARPPWSGRNASSGCGSRRRRR